jgi:hypothetical protein
MRKPKKKKDITEQWTYKVGNKLGKSIDKFSSNKKAVRLLIVILLAILFIFIVPIQNNIITLSNLAVLLIISYVLRRKK